MKMNKKFVKYGLLGLAMGGLFVSTGAFADTSQASNMGLAVVANNVVGSMSGMAKLITAASYVAGLGFAMAAIFKFMAHKNNPTQITIGNPIAMLLIAAGLLFMPSLFEAAGKTLFGNNAYSAGVTGTDQLPGQQSVSGGGAAL